MQNDNTAKTPDNVIHLAPLALAATGGTYLYDGKRGDEHALLHNTVRMGHDRMRVLASAYREQHGEGWLGREMLRVALELGAAGDVAEGA